MYTKIGLYLLLILIALLSLSFALFLIIPQTLPLLRGGSSCCCWHCCCQTSPPSGSVQYLQHSIINLGLNTAHPDPATGGASRNLQRLREVLVSMAGQGIARLISQEVTKGHQQLTASRMSREVTVLKQCRGERLQC